MGKIQPIREQDGQVSQATGGDAQIAHGSNAMRDQVLGRLKGGNLGLSR